MMIKYEGLLWTLLCCITVSNGFVVDNDCQTSDPHLPPISPCIEIMEWSIKRNDTTDICRMYSEAINCIAKRPQSQGCSFQQILTHYGSYVAAELSLPLNQCTVKEEPVICSDPTRLSVLGFNVCLPAWEPFEAAFGFDGCTYITFLHNCFADRSESIGPKCSKSEVTAAVMSEGALTWLNANYKSLVPRMNSTCGI